MSKFNAGDRVRIARPGRGLKEWQDFEAEVLKVDEGYDPYLKPLSDRPWGERASFYWPAEDLELVAPADTKPTLREALDTLREQEGLCGIFDSVVNKMLDPDPLVRLKYAAVKEDHRNLIPKLDAILNPPERPKPEYKVGDWVKVLSEDRVGRIGFVSDYGVCIDDVKVRKGLWYGFHEIEPSAPAVPEKGRWIRAKTKDGKTHEFKTHVAGVFLDEYQCISKHTDPANPEDRRFLIRVDGEPHPHRGNWVIDWEYIEAPKPPAKVGDVFSVREEVPVNGLYRDSDGHKAYRVKFTPKGAPNLFKGPGPFTLVWIDEEAK